MRDYPYPDVNRYHGEAKAKELFYCYLSPLQRRQLISSSWRRIFAVGSYSGKSYEIRLYNSNTQNVFSEDTRFCTVPKGVSIPLYDKYLIQKLMIENDEREFLRIAEKFRGYWGNTVEPELTVRDRILFTIAVMATTIGAGVAISLAYYLFGLFYNYFSG